VLAKNNQFKRGFVMKHRQRTLAELCLIAGKYSSPREFKNLDPMTFDAMRKRTSVYQFFNETIPKEAREQRKQPEEPKRVKMFEEINPRPMRFLLQFYWQTGQPSAAELSEG
jgi:hypothetical protein